MTIIAQLSFDVLKLSAYSYQETEFSIVRSFFRQRDFSPLEQEIRPDKYNRKGKMFIIQSLNTIARFQSILRITIFNQEGETKILPSNEPGSPNENPYCCIRLSLDVSDKGCVDIIAPDDKVAFLKCALIAGQLYWFGAESKRGKCETIRN
jgi:hypothetical protein